MLLLHFKLELSLWIFVVRFFFFSGHTSHKHTTDLRWSPLFTSRKKKKTIRNSVLNSNSINSYILFYFPMAMAHWTHSTRYVPIFCAETKPTLKIFVGQLHTSVVVPVCFNWMNVDLRYEAKLLMFQSAFCIADDHSVATLCTVFVNDVSLHSVHTLIADHTSEPDIVSGKAFWLFPLISCRKSNFVK